MTETCNGIVPGRGDAGGPHVLARMTRSSIPMGARKAQTGRINVKLILIIVAAVAVLAVGGFVARHVRRQIVAERDLAAGRAAYDRKDWPVACEHFIEYLGRRPDDVDVLRKYVEALLLIEPPGNRNLLRATSAYRQLIRLGGGDKEAYRKLVALYTHVGDLVEVGYLARKRLEEDPNDPEASLWLARSLIVRQETGQARKELTALVERLGGQTGRGREYVEACAMLADVALTEESEPEKGSEEAWRWVEKASAYDPNSPEALLARAKYYRMGQPFRGFTREVMLENARRDLGRVQQLPRPDPRSTLMLSEELMAHGELEQAAALMDDLRDANAATIREYFVDPDDWRIARFNLFAELLLRRGKAKEGTSESETLLSKLSERPRRLEVLPQVVRLYLAGGRTQKAQEHLDEYLQLRRVLQVRDGREEEVAVLRAQVALVGGKFEEAVRVLEPVAVRAEAGSAAMQLLARAYGRTGQLQRSSELLQRYLQRVPGDGAMWLLLAREHANQGNWRSALEDACRAESLRKGDPTTRLFRIEAAFRLAAVEPDPARKERMTALQAELAELQKAHRQLARVRSLQGQLLVAWGRLDEAVRSIEQAVKDLPGALDLRLQLANVYAAGGRLADALAVGRAACQDHPEVASTWQATARLQQADGHHGEARDTLRQGLQAATDPQQRKALMLSLAHAEMQYGDRAAGLRMLQEHVEQDAQDIETRSFLLERPEIRQDANTARKLLDEIRQVRGATSRLWRRHRAALWFTDDGWRDRWQSIAEALETWSRQDPHWPLPAILLARMYERLGQPDKAEQVCRQSLAMNPSSIEVADQMVSLLEKQNRHAEARRALDELHVDPSVIAGRQILMDLGQGDVDTATERLTVHISDNPGDLWAQILLARLTYGQTRDLKAALAHLDQAESVRPGSMVLLEARVSLLRAGGEADEARKLVDAEVARRGSSSAHLLRARFLAAIGQRELAEKDYLQVVKLDPKAVRSHQLLAYFYRTGNRLDEAEKALRHGLDAPLEHNDDYLALKRSLLELLIERRAESDWAAAERILAELEGRLGKKPDLLWARARLRMAKSATQPVKGLREDLEELVALEPTHVRGHLALVDLALQRRDCQGAGAIVAKALRANPGAVRLLLARMHVDLAAERLLAEKLSGKKLPVGTRALDALGEPQAAIAKLGAYVKTKPGSRSVTAMLVLAGLQRRQRNLPEAARWLGLAAELSPRSPAVLRERLLLRGAEKKLDEVVSLAAAHEAGGRADPTVLVTAAGVLVSSQSEAGRAEAEKLLRRAVALAPDWTSPKWRLGNLLYSMGEADQAETLYRSVVVSDPNHVQALNGLAWLLDQIHKDPNAALPLAERAARLAPRDIHVLDTRGEVLSHLPGRLEDAQKDFQMCLDLSDSPVTRARALLQLGRVCVDLGRLAEAGEHLREARKIDEGRRVLKEDDRRRLSELLRKAANSPS